MEEISYHGHKNSNSMIILWCIVNAQKYHLSKVHIHFIGGNSFSKFVYTPFPLYWVHLTLDFTALHFHHFI